MRKPNAEIKPLLLRETLKVVLDQGLDAVSMRDVAARCSVSATTIYRYWKDKDALLEDLKLYCLQDLKQNLLERLKRWGYDEEALAQGTKDPFQALKLGLEGFRDWAFLNPGLALLVMSGFKPNAEAQPAHMAEYYECSVLAEKLLALSVAQGKASSSDPRLDSALCIAALWGVIESVIRLRTWPDYWRRGGELTDRSIGMLLGWLSASETVYTNKESI